MSGFCYLRFLARRLKKHNTKYSKPDTVTDLDRFLVYVISPDLGAVRT